MTVFARDVLDLIDGLFVDLLDRLAHLCWGPILQVIRENDLIVLKDLMLIGRHWFRGWAALGLFGLRFIEYRLETIVR